MRFALHIGWLSFLVLFVGVAFVTNWTEGAIILGAAAATTIDPPVILGGLVVGAIFGRSWLVLISAAFVAVAYHLWMQANPAFPELPRDSSLFSHLIYSRLLAVTTWAVVTNSFRAMLVGKQVRQTKVASENRIGYDNRIFKSVANTQNGEVGGDTRFRYRQRGNVVWASYEGGGVTYGHLIATMEPDGSLDMRYHHVSPTGALMTGTCRSRLEILPDGRYRLHEEWQWTSGDQSRGTSIVEEATPKKD